ncbi:hypothetical protein THTE_0189 [Thermogutta terrifontis]|uniref:Uncharacterized protein n=1 Tax=Thermogutta terrifontis TaxID=1331910 RepID=A0A286RA07_9BACT|nr:hypothetical protein THTE_0189 [Thermogutta terrifontis]
MPGVIERVTIGHRRRVYPWRGLEERLPPNWYSVYIWINGEIVKAKAFTQSN